MTNGDGYQWKWRCEGLPNNPHPRKYFKLEDNCSICGSSKEEIIKKCSICESSPVHACLKSPSVTCPYYIVSDVNKNEIQSGAQNFQNESYNQNHEWDWACLGTVKEPHNIVFYHFNERCGICGTYKDRIDVYIPPKITPKPITHTDTERSPVLRVKRVSTFNVKRVLFAFLFYIILSLVLLCAIVLTNNILELTQFHPSAPVKDKHFLDRVTNNLIFSQNPLEFSTNNNHSDYNLLSNTQTNCQYGSNTYKCSVKIYIELNTNDNINKIRFVIDDPLDYKHYDTSSNTYSNDRLYITGFDSFSKIKTDDKLVVNGKLNGYIQYKSEDKIKEIYFSPTVKFVIPIPINDRKKMDL